MISNPPIPRRLDYLAKSPNGFRGRFRGVSGSERFPKARVRIGDADCLDLVQIGAPLDPVILEPLADRADAGQNSSTR